MSDVPSPDQDLHPEFGGPEDEVFNGPDVEAHHDDDEAASTTTTSTEASIPADGHVEDDDEAPAPMAAEPHPDAAYVTGLEELPTNAAAGPAVDAGASSSEPGAQSLEVAESGFILAAVQKIAFLKATEAFINAHQGDTAAYGRLLNALETVADGLRIIAEEYQSTELKRMTGLSLETAVFVEKINKEWAIALMLAGAMQQRIDGLHNPALAIHPLQEALKRFESMSLHDGESMSLNNDLLRAYNIIKMQEGFKAVFTDTLTNLILDLNPCGPDAPLRVASTSQALIDATKAAKAFVKTHKLASVESSANIGDSTHMRYTDTPVREFFNAIAYKLKSIFRRSGGQVPRGKYVFKAHITEEVSPEQMSDAVGDKLLTLMQAPADMCQTEFEIAAPGAHNNMILTVDFNRACIISGSAGARRLPVVTAEYSDQEAACTDPHPLNKALTRLLCQ